VIIIIILELDLGFHSGQSLSHESSWLLTWVNIRIKIVIIIVLKLDLEIDLRQGSGYKLGGSI
jgi:hypothetical protein